MDVSVDDELDLSPRPSPTARSRRRWPGLVALAVVAVGIVAVLATALGEATLFFYNADEAVERRAELDGERFRLQGLVVPDTVDDDVEVVRFEVTFNGVAVPVVHRGDPPELFQPDIPVVLEGGFGDDLVGEDSEVFYSDYMLVRHDENYEADYGERLDDAEQGSDEQGSDGQVNPGT